MTGAEGRDQQVDVLVVSDYSEVSLSCRNLDRPSGRCWVALLCRADVNQPLLSDRICLIPPEWSQRLKESRRLRS